MVNGKLILICQSGGEFEKKDDGTLAYNGGDAQAVNVSSEILFDDLKLKLAEICNLDQKTVSMKYFLPQNTRTLISVVNEKDLKRMLDFHASSVTVDVFVMGKEGFIRDALKNDAGRETGIKVAESVKPTGEPSDTSSLPLSDDSTSDNSDTSGSASSSPSTSPMKGTGQSSTNAETSCTSSDTVQKHKRATSLKLEADAPTIVSVPDDIRVPKRKRRTSVANNGTGDKNGDASLEKLIRSWRECITGVGQDFKNLYDFQDALQKYAIAHRFVYRLEKNKNTCASGICVAVGCPWKIHALWVPDAHSFRIKKFNKMHTCVGQPWKDSHSTMNWLVCIIEESLRDSPHHNPKDIGNTILREFGIELNYTLVWRGIEDVHKESYSQLPYYCKKIMECNPGSYVKLVTGDDKNFQSLFISLKSSINGFQAGCRPLLFLEATSLKSIYQEVLLSATAIDGDDCPFPVAFAIVDIENKGKWKWFLEQLQSVLPSSGSGSITFVFDREKGLKETVGKVFSNSYQGYSMYHLLNSFRNSLKGPFRKEGKAYLPRYFVAAAHVTRVIGFKRFTEQIEHISSRAYDWVMKIKPECWTTISYKGERHNQILENVGEMFTNLIEESKELTITKKIDAIMRMLTGLMCTRKYESIKWLRKLTPLNDMRLHEEIVDARGVKVLTSSNTIFEVRDEVLHVVNKNEASHVVNLDEAKCTCLGWQSTGMPCRHAIAVFNCKRKNLYEFCSKYVTADSYRGIYSELINPVPCEYDRAEKEKSMAAVEIVLPPRPWKCMNKPKIKEAKRVRVTK